MRFVTKIFEGKRLQMILSRILKPNFMWSQHLVNNCWKTLKKWPKNHLFLASKTVFFDHFFNVFQQLLTRCWLHMKKCFFFVFFKVRTFSKLFSNKHRNLRKCLKLRRCSWHIVQTTEFCRFCPCPICQRVFSKFLNVDQLLFLFCCIIDKEQLVQNFS